MTKPRSFLTGLFGAGIAASQSPQIHEAEAQALGARLIYRAIDFAALGLDGTDLGVMLQNAERLGYDGLNVTHPYKQRIIEHLDDLSADAARLGAVNTVVLRDGRRVGHNTDWYGFARSLDRQLPDVELGAVLQLGAGGAGAAVAYALLQRGVRRLHLFDLDRDRADILAAQLTAFFPECNVDRCDYPAAILAQVDGLVQTTPVGMTGHPGLPIALGALRPDHWVADIIYHPAETELLAAARARGCRRINGAAMVVLQAAHALHLFTGLRPSEERMLGVQGL